MSGLQCWTSGVNTLERCKLLADPVLRPRNVIYKVITARLAITRNNNAQGLRVGLRTGSWRALATGRRCVMSPPMITAFVRTFVLVRFYPNILYGTRGRFFQQPMQIFGRKLPTIRAG